jgi:hypothetical protein
MSTHSLSSGHGGAVLDTATNSGRWPAGTVVESDADKALVEISDDRGHWLDFIAVPHDALAPAGGHAERFAS